MTLRQIPFNNTDGTVVTTGNSGALSIASGTGSTQTYKAAAAYQGATGLELVTTGATSALRYQFTGAVSATQAAFSVMVKIPASVPSAAISLLQINDTAASKVISLTYTANGIVAVYDKSNTSITVLTAAQAVAGTWFRFEVVVSAISGTAGAFTTRAYNSSNAQVGSTASSSTANTGTTSMGGCYAGIVQTAVSITLDLDSLQLNDGATSEIGPYVANTTPPTITAGANQTVPATGTTVTLTCTATPAAGSGGIASYQWTPLSWPLGSSAPTITNPTSQTASFVPSVTGRYIFGVTATDTEGNTSAQATTRAFLPDVQIQVIEVTSSSGFTVGSIANDLSDISDSTYIDSGAPGSGNTLLARLKPLISTGTGFSLDIRSYVTATAGTQKVALLEGATVRKDWGTLSPGTAPGDIILTLTSAEMATIGSWNELDLRFTQV